MRLQQDEALWERELADLLSEMPAPRPGPPRVGVTTTARRWSGQPMPDDRRQVADAAMAPNAGMGYPAVSSVGPGCPAERHCRTREVMPPSMITSRQRLSCRPQ